MRFFNKLFGSRKETVSSQSPICPNCGQGMDYTDIGGPSGSWFCWNCFARGSLPEAESSEVYLEGGYWRWRVVTVNGDEYVDDNNYLTEAAARDGLNRVFQLRTLDK